MKQEVLIGQQDFTVLIKIRTDAGAPATALTEASIDIAYARVETDNDVTTTDVTPAALTALTDAHTDWGFEEVSATDHPGLYRLDIADAVFASGAWSAVVTVVGTGLDPADCEFVLVAVDPKAATMPANYIAATSITNDAFTAAKFHPDVTTELQSGLATAAELAKVPKSDSNVTWNATAAAQIQSEAADALNAYDPPTRTEATSDKDEVLAKLPAALVGGRMDSSVGAMAANTMTAAAAAADLTTELQSGLALEATAQSIKTKTDSLTFTVAGVVDGNVQRINDVAITGDGQVGTEFGV